MDRKTAEVLAARATRIAVAVLGDQQQALDVVTRAAERVRLEGTQGHTYEAQFLKTIIAEIRGLSPDAQAERRGGLADDARNPEPAMDLHRLCIEDRILVALCSVGGLSYSDAARLTGLSTQEVLTRLARARRQIWEANA